MFLMRLGVYFLFWTGLLFILNYNQVVFLPKPFWGFAEMSFPNIYSGGWVGPVSLQQGRSTRFIIKHNVHVHVAPNTNSQCHRLNQHHIFAYNMYFYM